MMLGGGTLYGGGSWTCHKCGQVIFGSSINHDCRKPGWGLFKQKVSSRKIRIRMILKRIAGADGKISGARKNFF